LLLIGTTGGHRKDTLYSIGYETSTRAFRFRKRVVAEIGNVAKGGLRSY